MATIMRTAYFISFLCIPLVARATPDDRPKTANSADKCFLWKTQSDKATVYLLGSIHVGITKLYPVDASIQSAYEDADTIVVEIDITKVDQLQMQQYVMRHGMYSGDKSLSTELSKKTLNDLQKFMKKRQLSMAQFEKMQPWFLGLNLSLMEITRAKFDPEKGIDLHFLRRAHKDKKNVEALETAVHQLSMLSSGTKKEQEASLRSFLDEYEEIKSVMKTLIRAWRDGDVKAMEKEIFDRDVPDLEPLMKRMFDDRNVKMTEKIEGYLKTDKTYLVIVGSGHLIGKKGIVQLLKDKKYDVEQVRKAKAKS